MQSALMKSAPADLSLIRQESLAFLLVAAIRKIKPVSASSGRYLRAILKKVKLQSKQRYVKSLARGGKRFDLALKPVGVVSAEEKAAAEKMCLPKAEKPAAVTAEAPQPAADPVASDASEA